MDQTRKMPHDRSHELRPYRMEPPTMTVQSIRFDDGAVYERTMGVWSGLAGRVFLDWLAPRDNLRWVDVGCGNGAFTELLCQRHAPAAVDGIDPSEGQLAFARAREGARQATFHQGDAMALPFGDAVFDAAVMALVIFFVPEPARGVAEMARVVAPGGSVSAYAWDIPGGGFPLDAMWTGLRAMGLAHPLPPNVEAARLEALHGLWVQAGLRGVETRQITVQRRFADFEDYWETSRQATSVAATIAAMPPGDVEALRARLRARITTDDAGQVICEARANAVKGVVA